MEDITLLETNIDVAVLANILSQLEENQWHNIIDYKTNKTREETYEDHHKDTKTIPIKNNGMHAPGGEFVLDDPRVSYTYPEFHRSFYYLLKPILDRLVPKYGAIVSKLLLVKLPASEEVAEHADIGPTLEAARRIHIPIITNDKVRFTVGSTSVNMLAGCAYEIDNQKLHYVENNGDIDRVHMIIDIYDEATFLERSQYNV